MTPLALMYAILKRHIIDARFIISRTVVYAAITTIVVGIIGVVDWATSVYLAQARTAMAIDAVVTIGLGFVLHRAYARLEYAVDFLLFSDKHETQEYLARLGRTLQRAEREETVDRAVVDASNDKADLTMAALYRVAGKSFVMTAAAGIHDGEAREFNREHELVRFLATERAKLHVADLRAHIAAEFQAEGGAPAVAIPLFQGDRLVAFAVYGIHRDGHRTGSR
ncbi:MAG: hypothetical protein M3Y18_08185 [Candidatus Eremiobacteraeota bacterium]|nr:hypothetical protein [Candidatus Eremiobacteraeota bacterium]